MTMINCVLPISTLFPDMPSGFVSKFRTAEHKRFDDRDVPVFQDRIFHSDYAVVNDSFLAVLEKQEAFRFLNAYRVRRFSFDIGPCFRQVEVVDNRYVGIGQRLNMAEIYELCEERLNYLRQRLHGACELAVENMNYYSTGAYEDVCEPEFYNEICHRYDLKLVFDVAHAQVTACNRRISLRDYIRKYDFSLVREIHLSKIGIVDGEAVDAHDKPDDEEFEILLDLIGNISRGIDVVIEYYKDIAGLMKAYERLEQVLHENVKNNTPS